VRAKFLLACLMLMVILSGRTLLAQFTGDVIGMHDLGPGSKSPITGARPDFCSYCHEPHSSLGGRLPLWNQKLTVQTYNLYTSTTEKNRGMQPLLGADSNLCLSCHDGTVAPGTTVVYGQVTMTGSMYSYDVFGSNLQPSHPFSLVLPLKDNIDLIASLASKGVTGDPTGAIRLINGNIECTSCHNAHVQAKDLISQNFLVRNSANGQMCLACHDPTRQMAGKVNPLANWTSGAHAIASNKISPQAGLGSYTTVSQDACISCHTPHNAQGPARLLRGFNEQDCIACHNGGSNITPAPRNVFAEYATPKVGHPFPTQTAPHDAAETVLLNNNRHSTCVDCHNGHGSAQVGTFPPPPLIRVSQKDVAGISATDGITVVNPAVNQYETCFRCHGSSTGEAVRPIYGYLPSRVASAGNPLNIIPQFAVTASSSHPVTHVSSSPLYQYSLLGNMLQLDGVTQGRAMGTQIFCTDCHNADDNREFGGTGPSGPHGSKWTHILERRYEFSQTVAPGQLIENLFRNPDLSVNGPYALCGKCHSLSNIMTNASFSQHSTHINAGFTCSTCHTAHGMGGVDPNLSGQRLVNFDVNVVAQNGAAPISYNHATNTCVLACHETAHNPNGSVGAVAKRPTLGAPIKK
jgi:predicted CXXCH cytochrome family protein